MSIRREPITKDGFVAMTPRSPIGQKVIIQGVEYNFQTLHGVTMTWVRSEHIDDLFKIKKRCCGGHETTRFVYASQGQIRLWETGER